MQTFYLTTIKELNDLIISNKESFIVPVIHLESKSIMRLEFHMYKTGFYVYLNNCRLDKFLFKKQYFYKDLLVLFLNNGLRFYQTGFTNYSEISKINITQLEKQKELLLLFLRKLYDLNLIDKSIPFESILTTDEFDNQNLSLPADFFFNDDKFCISIWIDNSIYYSRFIVNADYEFDWGVTRSLQIVNLGDEFNVNNLIKDFIKLMCQYDIRGPGIVNYFEG